MALSGSDFLLSFPLTVYFLIENSIDYLPFNWDDVHYRFSYVGIYTEEEFGYYWAGDRLYTSVLLAKYILPLLAFLFFLFFGVAEDAVAEYFRWYHGVRRMLRLKPSQHDQQ